MPSPRHARLARLANLFKQVFETEDGKQVLAELKTYCFIDDTTIAISPGANRTVDPYLMVRNEGRRQVLLYMLKMAGMSYYDIERVRTIDEMEARNDIEAEIARN